MKILLIGNKDIENDISKKIKLEKFDIIVRYNRMTNFDKTKTDHTDIYLYDIGEWCYDLYKQEYYKCEEKFLNVSTYIGFVNTTYKFLKFKKYDDIFKPKNIKYITYNALPIKKYINTYDYYNGYRVTNAIWMIIFLLEKYKNYDIYITAIDYEDRSFLSNQKCHYNIYHKEEEFIQKMIKEKKITPIFY